jgi:hypothetical protein
MELAFGGAHIFAQGLDQGFISRSAPTPAFVTPEPARYNLKFGKLEARLRTSMQIEANDNIGLSATNRSGDVSFNPFAEVGFVYPISEIQLMEMNFGLGYKWYWFHPSVSRITIDPKTRLDYRLRLLHPVEMRAYDTFSIVSDPTTRPDLSGPANNLEDFDLLTETIGVLLNYEPASDFRIAAGVSYSISRSLTENFTALDLNTYTFSLGAYYRVSPRLTVGLGASYALNYFSTNYKSTAESYTIGPTVIFRPSQFIYVDASVGYTTMHIDQTGLDGDNSQPGGSIGATLQVIHKINTILSQDVNLSNGLLLGLENNFNQIFSAQYGLTGRFRAGMSLRSSFTYSKVQTSGPLGGEAAQYLFYIGTGRQITRLWSGNLGYAFALKDSSNANQGYMQNRLTLDITREF